MNEEQRTKKVASVYGADLEDVYSYNDFQGVAQTCYARCDKGNDSRNELSITAAAMKDSLDIHIAEQLWKKAKRLISQPDTIMPAPSTEKSTKAFSVLSESGNTPNFVKVFNSAKITCTCRNYKPKKICSHAISVAESQGVLREFVAWYRKQKVPTNLTSVATLTTNVKASGRKQGAPKRQRKTKDAVLQYEASLVLSIEDGGKQAQSNISTSASVAATDQVGLVPTSKEVLMPTASVHSPPLQLAGHLHSSSYLTSTQVLPSTFSSLNSPVPVANPHVAVPPGQPLPPKPTLPDTSTPYFLAKFKGNIARCNGCGNYFERDLPSNTLDSEVVVGRKERDWYPFVFHDGSKCWRLGRSQNHYYHASTVCIKTRNPLFTESHLTGVARRLEGGLILSNELLRQLWERFRQAVFC